MELDLSLSLVVVTLLPPQPPLPPTLPGSVSAQALTPPADPPRYTFAPSASLNKTARPFGAPPPTDSTPQQNGYVSPAHSPTHSCLWSTLSSPVTSTHKLPATAQSVLYPSPLTVWQQSLAAG